MGLRLLISECGQLKYHSRGSRMSLSTIRDGLRSDNSKKVAVVVRPQDFFALGTWPRRDPTVDEWIFEKGLVARHQDPITRVIPSLRVTRIFDPHSLFAQLLGQGPDDRTKVKVVVGDMEGENSAGHLGRSGGHQSMLGHRASPVAATISSGCRWD